jgi:hypothetical protein
MDPATSARVLLFKAEVAVMYTEVPTPSKTPEVDTKDATSL